MKIVRWLFTRTPMNQISVSTLTSQCVLLQIVRQSLLVIILLICPFIGGGCIRFSHCFCHKLLILIFIVSISVWYAFSFFLAKILITAHFSSRQKYFRKKCTKNRPNDCSCSAKFVWCIKVVYSQFIILPTILISNFARQRVTLSIKYLPLDFLSLFFYSFHSMWTVTTRFVCTRKLKLLKHVRAQKSFCRAKKNGLRIQLL